MRYNGLESQESWGENVEEVKLIPMQLCLVKAGTIEKAFAIREGSNLIGRWDAEQGAFPDIDLETEDADAMVSRKHALVQRHINQASVQDLGSLNGTFLNRRRIAPEDGPQVLNDGDELIVGKVVLRFEIKH